MQSENHQLCASVTEAHYKLLFFLFIYFHFMHMCMCACAPPDCRNPQKPRRALTPLILEPQMAVSRYVRAGN